jgi:hypothetical protein
VSAAIQGVKEDDRKIRNVRKAFGFQLVTCYSPKPRRTWQYKKTHLLAIGRILLQSKKKKKQPVTLCVRSNNVTALATKKWRPEYRFTEGLGDN